MSFVGSSEFSHAQPDAIGVLLVNLGTPDQPKPGALRRYLREFLSDRRVVEIPRLLWMLILHGIILRTRPKKSAHAYASIWTPQGSPLRVFTEGLAQQLQQKMATDFGGNLIVDYAMRYGTPSMTDKLQSLCDRGVRKLVVLPLYPQYAGSTTASTFDALARDFMQRRWLPDLRFVMAYYRHPAYIAALAQQVRAWRAEHGEAELLVLSYHGVPQQMLERGDPYHCQCHATTRLLAEALGLRPEQYVTTFQSRLGRAKWLQPYTDATLKGLPAKGVRSVQVFCPGFAVDCLETLEEIGVENRDYFLGAGGQRYEYIPALNDSSLHVDALQQVLLQELRGWELPTDMGPAREQRYKGLLKASQPD